MNKRIKSLVLGASLVASMAILGGCGSNNIGYVDSVKVANSTEKGIEITKEINAKKAELDAKIAAADEASKQNVYNQANKELNAFKDTIIDKSINATMIPMRDPKLNTSRASKIFGLFESRIRELSPHEFQNLLRPAFKEDEMTLVILGAITGLLAGWLHLITVFF